MWEDNNGDSGKAPANGVHHLAIVVDKLDSVMEHIKREGIEIIADVYEPTRGIREAIVRGPDNVRVQFVERNLPLLIWRIITGDLK
jgi:hypothetical protein